MNKLMLFIITLFISIGLTNASWIVEKAKEVGGKIEQTGGEIVQETQEHVIQPVEEAGEKAISKIKGAAATAGAEIDTFCNNLYSQVNNWYYGSYNQAMAEVSKANKATNESQFRTYINNAISILNDLSNKLANAVKTTLVDRNFAICSSDAQKTVNNQINDFKKQVEQKINELKQKRAIGKKQVASQASPTEERIAKRIEEQARQKR